MHQFLCILHDCVSVQECKIIVSGCVICIMSSDFGLSGVHAPADRVAIKLGVIFSLSFFLSRHLLNLQEGVILGYPNFTWAPK